MSKQTGSTEKFFLEVFLGASGRLPWGLSGLSRQAAGDTVGSEVCCSFPQEASWHLTTGLENLEYSLWL